MYVSKLTYSIAILLLWRFDDFNFASASAESSESILHRNDRKLELLRSLLDSGSAGSTLQIAKRWHLKSANFEQESLTRNEVRDSSSEEAAKLNDDELIALAKSILHSRNSAHKRTVRSADEAPTESNATVTNSTDQEGMANTSLQAKVSNTSSLAEVSNSSVQAEGASNASSPIHTVSNVSRLVSYGYNLIRGCPDEYRGLDGGIRTSLPIFKFTFNQGKSDPYFNSATSLPDQVYFEPHMDKALTTSHNIYGGEKSYRDTMITGVSAAGGYKAFQFSASQTIADLHEEAITTKSLYLDRKRTLNLGEVSYIQSEQNDITDEFFEAVMNLPPSFFLSESDKQKYFSFFDQWGTDVIRRAEVGLKHIIRYRANYTSAYLFARATCGNALEVGEVDVGRVRMNVKKLNSMIAPGSQFGSYRMEREFGTEQEPIPTKLYLEPITRALDRQFWTLRFGDSNGNASAVQMYNSLQIRQRSMGIQLNEYAQTVGSSLKDPEISIPIEWPRGTYSFPKTTSGCPANFSSGCRTQDNEDQNNQNMFSENIEWALEGEFHNSNENIQTCYCSKNETGDSIFTWMPGRYCINRKNGSCPADFETGYIEWDDEDTNNVNTYWGELPDGDYPKGRTQIYYCCRDDGNTQDEMLLPNTQPFILYPYKEDICQEVHGMEHEQHFVYTDDEDSNNQGKCVQETPFVPNECTAPDIKLTYCYYRPK